MPETTSDVGVVERLIESGHRHSHSPTSPPSWVEVLEALVLALVAVSTAWSGFQAAKWSGLSGEQISLGLRTTVVAQEKMTLAGQDRLYDVFMFDDWLQAKAERKEKLADFYERRFRPEYATLFADWLKLDPFHNRSAPPGPVFMSQYTNANARESTKLSEEARRFIENGVSLRVISEKYVKVTVFLATVLLLTAIGQRLRRLWLRAGVAAAACLLLGSSAYYLLTLPRTW